MFTHLHCHCSHSLLDGLGNPDRWVDAALENGFDALALTDHASISAAWDFFQAARGKSLQPIVGTEFYFMDDPTARPKDRKTRLPRYHLTALAKNWNGVTSIFRQLTRANEQFYYRPLLSTDQLTDFKDCVIMTACSVGVLQHPMYERLALGLQGAYGDDFYLEIMPHWLEGQRVVNQRAIELATAHGIPLVATNDAHYPRVQDTLTHDLLLAVQTNSKWDDPDRFSFLGGENGLDGLYLRTASEMIHAFKPWVQDGTLTLEKLRNSFMATEAIRAKCAELAIPELPFALPLPKAVLESGVDEETYFRKLCMKGWMRLIDPLPCVKAPYLERLKHEISVISKIGAIRYFLIVHDILQWAKARGILCGFGRGSAGGSLVCWLLGIHNLDPIEHELYFERFLRADRIDMPDIDLDFAGNDRTLVIDYIRSQYGAENVCQISTVSEMHGKTAFRDTARVFGVPNSQINEISKLLDNELTIEQNFQENSALADFAAANPSIVRHASRLDGQLRSKGVHAGGVIISEDGFGGRGVLERRAKTTAINWDMGQCERFGLLKIDALGLNNLAVLQDAAEMVKARTGEEVDLFAIKPDDPAVLRQFSDGHTAGFFQFESTGITALCKRLAPIKSFNTLVDINALYRPGPLDAGMVDSYVARYRKEEAVAYLHPKETPIVEMTLGLPVFQEQIMRYFVDLAGWTWPEADTMRKIISKSKGREKLEEKRAEFVAGCQAFSGIAPEVSNRIYDAIVTFGRYGFNKAHAACYSLIAYLTAYMKHHHPREFMCALLRSVIGEDETTANYVKEARRLGIEVLGPSIQHSRETFTINGRDAIVTGFSSIKGIGGAAAEALVSARGRHGIEYRPFATYADFWHRTTPDRRKINKRVVQVLAKAGAFDTLIDGNARLIFDSYETMTKVGGPVAPHYPWPKAVSDWEEAEKTSYKIEVVPGVFDPDDIAIEANLEVDLIPVVNDRIIACDREACPIGKAAEGGPIPARFARNSKVLAVMDCPSMDDLEAGGLLTRNIGKAFFELARSTIGITSGVIAAVGLYSCRPKSGKIPSDDLGKWCCSRWVEEVIRASRPTVILSMGSASYSFFTGKSSGVMKAAGTSMWHPKYKALVVFSIAPGALLVDRDGSKQDLVEAALRKVGEYLPAK